MEQDGYLLEHSYCARGSNDDNVVQTPVSEPCVLLCEADLNSDTYETTLLNLLRYHTSYLDETDLSHDFPIEKAEISPDALDALSPQQIQTLITSNAMNYDVIQQLQRQKISEKEIVPATTSTRRESSQTVKTEASKPVQQTVTPIQEPVPPVEEPVNEPAKPIHVLKIEGGDGPEGIAEDQLMEIQRHVKELIISQQASLPKGLTSEQQQQLVEKLLLRQIQQLQQQQGVNLSSIPLDSHTHNIPPLHGQELNSRELAMPITRAITSSAGNAVASAKPTEPITYVSSKTIRKKDPNKPFITPYNLFIHEISGVVKEEYPNAAFSELPKLYSKKWNSLSVEEKKVYSDKHQRMIEEYKASLLVTEQQQPAEENMDTGSTAVTIQDTTTLTQGVNTTPNTTFSPPAKPTCANDGCCNPPVPSEDRGVHYCSNDCVVKHCGKVFDVWIKSRQLQIASS